MLRTFETIGNSATTSHNYYKNNSPLPSTLSTTTIKQKSQLPQQHHLQNCTKYSIKITATATCLDTDTHIFPAATEIYTESVEAVDIHEQIDRQASPGSNLFTSPNSGGKITFIES